MKNKPRTNVISAETMFPVFSYYVLHNFITLAQLLKYRIFENMAV
jgi:hypothetical protein